MKDIKRTQNMMEAKRLEQIIFHNANKNCFKIDRKCSCCQAKITETDVMFIGENSLGVWFNCTGCDSTMVQVGNTRLKGPTVA